tara:strand:+ start:7168 stop:7584 length:417 start_codon:yes stop_codon:yes gene_type:complete
MKFPKALTQLGSRINKAVTDLNTSKIFAGVMIIILNISSRFVDLKISKSFESYLKYTFSRQLLIFAIAWMGTRDIYVAIIIVILFTVIVDFLCNENSNLCCFSNDFKDYHIELMTGRVSKDDVNKAKETIQKYNQQNS